MDGIWRTRVGYAGGRKEQPTYGSMGDHTECFEVDFDPSVVTYEDLLEIFWQSHDPTRQAWKVQYASVILGHSDEQLSAATASAERFSSLIGRRVATRIEPIERFWLAEGYHQKYYLQGHNAFSAMFHSIYPQEPAFIASTAAARINGYLYGMGTCARLERDLPGLGLDHDFAEHLRSHCRG